MKRALLVLTLCLGAVISARQAYAHHSFAATYQEGEKQTIDGTVLQFLLRNPHSFVQVETKDSKGVVTVWAIEWAAAGQLGGQGIKRDTLKPGEHVLVVGNPGRNAEDHRLRMVNVTRLSDGAKFGGSFD